MIPSSELNEGDLAIIKKIEGNGLFKKRLLEMGFQPGQKLYVEKYAPLRDPIEFVIMGYHVSLRRKEASHILVRKIHRHHKKKAKRKHKRRHRRGCKKRG